jgi:CDP-glycerol glycerophosphotransferase
MARLPNKKIELDSHSHTGINQVMLRMYSYLTGRFPVYDLLISPSAFYTQNVFSKAFRFRNVLECNYPRNDCLSGKSPGFVLAPERKSLQRIEDLKRSGLRVILYAPTYRDSLGDAIKNRILNMGRLVDFCRNYKILFIFKSHPRRDFNQRFPESENIILYENNWDVYPLLPLVDSLITDYSSLYIDYLLLDKPIIFLPYDYRQYIKKEKKLYFNYECQTPGPKCLDQEGLEKEIIKCLDTDQDKYAEARKRMLAWVFAYQDGRGSERILGYIKNSRQLNSGPMK